MIWISCRVLQLETSCSRKSIKAALVCRSAVLPCTLPVFTSSAAYKDRVPFRRYPSLQLGCSYGRLLARMPLFHQPCHTMCAKSLLPTRDSRRRGIQHLLDLPVRDALAQQHHTRSHHITCRKTPRLRHLLQFLSLFLAYNDRSSPEWHVNQALNSS